MKAARKFPVKLRLSKRTKSKFFEMPKLKSTKKKVPVKKHSQQKVVIQKKPSKKFADYADDCNYDWTLKFSQMRLEDITDISRGERKMMIMWNLHLQTYKVVGIRKMNSVVMEFTDAKKEEILKENLYPNFMSHLCNLQQTGVLSQETFLSAVSKLQESITSEEMSGQDLTRSWSSHFPRSERARRQLLVSPEEREEEMLLDQEIMELNMLLEEEEVEEMSLLDVEIWNLNRFLAEEEEEMSLLDLKIEIDD